MELADVTDSKSVGSNTVRVRPPPSAPKKAGLCLNRYSPAFFGAGGVRTRTVRVVQGCTMAVAQSRCTMQRPKRPQFDNPAPLPLQQTGIALLFLVLGGANSHCAGRARMHDSGRTESLHDAATQTTAIRHPATLPLPQTGIALLFLVLGGEFALCG